MKIKKLASVLAIPLMLPAMVSSSGLNVSGAEPDEYHDDWLHVNDKAQIVDMQGNPVWLTGCNWFGYNVGSQVFDGVWSRNMHECLNEIADHGFNLLRVPMSTQLLLQWKNQEPDPMIKVNEYSNPELTIEGKVGGTPMYSFDIWNKAVEWCRENGIKIMIDIHSAETASAGHQVAVWYNDKYSTEDWIEALEWFTDYYKDDDTILAIDLKNEPHGTSDVAPNMAKWDDSTDRNNWKYAAEQCAAKIMDINPNLLIVVEGIEVYPKFEEGATWNSPNIDYARYPYSYFYGAWWGANFRGARDYPIDLGEHQSQLVYSPHDYGPLVFEQTWFDKDFTEQTLLDDYWYDTWAYLCEENIAPLLMGEWGGFIDEEHDKDGKNKKWLLLLRDYMIKHHINHTFWCFNENSGDTGGLVYDNFEKWDEEKYELVKPALWQDDNGKFISLDHKIPMGRNGISLSDYYGSKEPAESTKSTETTAKPTKGSSGILYGDANQDGSVNVADAVAVSSYVVDPENNPLTAEGIEASDVHERGNGVNASDAFAIQQFATGIISEFTL